MAADTSRPPAVSPPGVPAQAAPPNAARTRVCVVAPSLDILGGQAVQAKRLIDRLRESPELEVAFLPVNPRLPGPWRALQRVKYLRTVVTSAAYVLRLLREVPRCDVVHSFSASYWSFLLAPLPAMLVGRLYGRRVVLNYHSGEADDHLARWRRTAVPAMRRLPHRIVVPSQYLVDVFARHGLAAQAIVNFIELRDIPHRTRTRLSPSFLSNRNFEPHYNVACVLRAFALIQAAVPEARLVVAGDGSCREALRELAHTLELRDVRFVGQVAPEAMGRLYDAADIYLNASDIDNMPLSIIEAHAAGVPVVTTDAGGIPYIVSHEDTALVIARDDARGMAEGALRLLRDPTLAARLSTRGRAECVARYVWPAVRREWEELYASLARRAALAPGASRGGPTRAVVGR